MSAAAVYFSMRGLLIVPQGDAGGLFYDKPPTFRSSFDFETFRNALKSALEESSRPSKMPAAEIVALVAPSAAGFSSVDEFWREYRQFTLDQTRTGFRLLSGDPDRPEPQVRLPLDTTFDDLARAALDYALQRL